MTTPSRDSLHYPPEATLARQWTKAMWNSELWKQVCWLGVPVLQWPTDLILMQELMAKLRPRCVVETGLYLGGTAIYYASLLQLLGVGGTGVFLGGTAIYYPSLLQLLGIEGRVISIDIRIDPAARANIEASPFHN